MSILLLKLLFFQNQSNFELYDEFNMEALFHNLNEWNVNNIYVTKIPRLFLNFTSISITIISLSNIQIMTL